MITRRAALAGAGALAVPTQAQDLRSLKSIAAAKGFVFGAAAATYELKDADYPPLLLRQASQLVPEYEMKRNVLEPRQGQHDFSALDLLWNFARQNGLTMRGHPLVWYYANPPWLKPALQARRDETLLAGHIDAVLKRYALSSVDVVNEAILPDGTGLRPSLWLDAFGPGYIDMAFHAARAANPKTRLVYNDFGCEQGPNDRFRAAQLKLLDGLLARKVPLDALGLQGHLNAFGKAVDQKKLRDFLQEIHDRGLAILVTELDVDDTGGPSDIAARDRAVADETRRFLDVVLDTPATVAVLTWNLTDRYADPPDEAPLKALGWRYRKGPYDARLAAKPMWDAMAQAFAGRRIAY
ncbi:MAG: Beta-xylanase [Alphaproteobacteria bacterium]|nr:Beta-xylanase [Alphaproteobacteria bacterium]MDB5741583.1 Beta-xylanase [Alphaproteobacteria bacterium]